VKVNAEDLADPAPGRGAADLGFGGIVSAARARQVACDAELRRFVLSPDGEVLDVGRSQRLVTPAIRKAVEARDQHCVFAGCGAPNHWCEVGLPGFGGRSDVELGIGDRAAVAEG
jgi:uncharacterized protein DUF222